jgi:hypothetical protein
MFSANLHPDTLSGDGRSTNEKKVYEVTILHGMTQNRLLSVDGRIEARRATR